MVDYSYLRRTSDAGSGAESELQSEDESLVVVVDASTRLPHRRLVPARVGEGPSRHGRHGQAEADHRSRVRSHSSRCRLVIGFMRMMLVGDRDDDDEEDDDDAGW